MNQEGRNQKFLPSIHKKMLTYCQQASIIKYADKASEYTDTCAMKRLEA